MIYFIKNEVPNCHCSNDSRISISWSQNGEKVKIILELIGKWMDLEKNCDDDDNHNTNELNTGLL